MSSEGYFAYGANMATRVLRRRRVPTGPGRAAVLRGYTLHFGFPGIPWVEPGFATLREDPDGVVHGVLFAMEPEALARLDRFEGAQERIPVEVICDGAPLAATTYRSRRCVEGLRPSRRYRGLLIEGAREHGLPAEYIAELEATPAAYVPLLSEYFALSLWLMEALGRLLELRAWLSRRQLPPE